MRVLSTEVTLPSGSSEAIHVGSSPVVRTRVRAKFCLSSYLFFFALTPNGDGTDLILESSVFVLKTLIKSFLNARHRPHQARTTRVQLGLFLLFKTGLEGIPDGSIL